MAAPGKIKLDAPPARQLLFDVPVSQARWYRLINHGPGTMGVTYTSATGSIGISAQIQLGLSMDFLAAKIEVRNDGGGEVSGVYEELLPTG